jgi:hypothetical protein
MADKKSDWLAALDDFRNWSAWAFSPGNAMKIV